jgi:hypothetical protein
MRVDPIPGVPVIVAVISAVGTAVTVAALVGDGFNVGIRVGNAFASDEGVGDKFWLSVPGVGVRLATPDGVASLTGTLPGCGRMQAQVTKIKTTKHILLFFMLSPS